MTLFFNILIPILVLIGLWMMSRVPSAVKGNRISMIAMALAVLVALFNGSLIAGLIGCLFILVGGIVGIILARKVTMIQMPQTVGLLNGFGGAASALVGIVTLMYVPDSFESFTSVLAVIIGFITLSGSLIAAGKLHRVIKQQPTILPNHSLILMIVLILLAGTLIWGGWFLTPDNYVWVILVTTILSLLFGWIFTIRVGGADMPITISLLNSLSGVAGGIAGMAINNVMLVAIGGIVGASGLLLTQVMCRAMNRSLIDILLGKTSAPAKSKSTHSGATATNKSVEPKPEAPKTASLADTMKAAKSVIIVPGYGMALAQAQQQVKQLGDAFEENGAKVRYAIHPVAGRMPGHMNVLLAEANVDYDQLFEMEQINGDFVDTDLVVVVGANDVLNPAARDAEGTPIYGMPVLNVDQAKNIIICNYDLKPGYANVPNPLYDNKEKVTLMLGDAKDSVGNLIKELHSAESQPTASSNELADTMKAAKSVIIVPGYGMALAQAQQQVKQLGDAFEENGAKVRYAIHPVAGRMPGHMNVLLAEANVDYDQLFEMEQINGDFVDTDLVVVVGANDVLNPAARDAEGTPIYGMPVLNVDQAKNIIICNYDLKPGYANVPNPLYDNKEKVTLMLGDAKDSVGNLIKELHSAESQPTASSNELADTMKAAKSVIIVPGYGMALAQAQQQVKQLGDAFEENGAKVRYAIHPVAGRMPGHMNVLLAEANVDYDQLFEMEQINGDFVDTDLVVVVGANDVLNPAARDAEGTPIYGMPVLNVDQAKNIIICNYDLKPGYANVPNPLYDNKEKVTLMLGDAKDSVGNLIKELHSAESQPTASSNELADTMKAAKSVIIVPGYGMALAQAQQQVKQLGDAFEENGAKVRYAIHPVAGRMPGHMNVLLAEANVDYDQLFEMEQINGDFVDTDLVVVVGANDVLNPAARDAEGTPIYGMPVLNVDQAKNIIICNYDLKPGYANVPNPLYDNKEKVTLMLGDAKDSVATLIGKLR
ncbi:MAG: NAD(P)(+) transhydrogenase (Re/Si-specific) subunit beta [Porphyromonas sp.]|nr:NAD(P)(+) transhydrogenase (Re/Si-specific) subunit beta [Porphyromonas sp.]